MRRWPRSAACSTKCWTWCCGGRWPLDAATRAELAALDLDAARVLLQGRGAGLTPAGDDVLAGLLLVHRWWWPGSDEARAVAAAADTTELSRAFLRWAAVGQSVQPVHELAAAAGRDHAAAVAAARVVAGIGGSSGAGAARGPAGGRGAPRERIG